MARPLRAFISYRRNDSFTALPDGTHKDTTTLTRIVEALTSLGFEAVFLDQTGFKGGETYISMIYNEIAQCDLFVMPIGHAWSEILTEKARSDFDDDILRREVEAALKLENEIVPLLFDGAAMPTAGQLPEPLVPLLEFSGLSARRDMSVAEFAKLLAAPVANASAMTRLGTGWDRFYVAFSLVAFGLIAVLPNAVGVWEFGRDAWVAMALMWSGMFIWPAFGLPFILVAFYAPVRYMIEAALNAPTLRSTLVYAVPLWGGTILAVAATIAEVGPPEVPWTIHPKLAASCVRAAPEPPPSAPAATTYDQLRQTVFRLGDVQRLSLEAGDRFWIADTCWPAAFFYLTLPAARPDLDLQNWRDNHPAVRDAFNALLENKNTPYSKTFFAYVVAVGMLLWLCIVGVAMAVMYALVTVRRKRDMRELRQPSDDASLCLTFAFIPLMAWVPFRMHTNHVKWVYTCFRKEPCSLVEDYYYRDAALFLLFFIAFLFVISSMLWRQRRLLLGVIAFACAAVLAAGAYGVAARPFEFARLAERWQFWTLLGAMLAFVFVMLWLRFDPAIVRFEEFRSGLSRRRRRPA